MLVALALTSCKKTSEAEQDQNSVIKEKLLTLKSSKTLSKEDVAFFTSYLNDRNHQDRNDVLKTLNASLSTNKASNSSQKNTSSTKKTFSEPTAQEILDGEFYEYQPWEVSGGLSLETLSTYRYEWVMRTIRVGGLDICSIISTERCKVVYLGTQNWKSWMFDGAMAITHGGSHITGFAPGITWNETYNEQFTNESNAYTAYLRTEGVMSGLGINRPVSSIRFVDASRVIDSNGAYYQ